MAQNIQKAEKSIKKKQQRTSKENENSAKTTKNRRERINKTKIPKKKHNKRE